MKSYSEIFNEVLKVYRFETIQDLHESAEPTTLQSFMYDLSLETQKECLKNAYNNAELDEDDYFKEKFILPSSIISENNLIK